jgi:hypothetical protein
MRRETEMNDLYVLQSELDYRRDKVRQELRPVRRRRWQRRRDHDGVAGATTEQSWIH